MVHANPSVASAVTVQASPASSSWLPSLPSIWLFGSSVSQPALTPASQVSAARAEANIALAKAADASLKDTIADRKQEYARQATLVTALSEKVKDSVEFHKQLEIQQRAWRTEISRIWRDPSLRAYSDRQLTHYHFLQNPRIPLVVKEKNAILPEKSPFTAYDAVTFKKNVTDAAIGLLICSREKLSPKVTSRAEIVNFAKGVLKTTFDKLPPAGKIALRDLLSELANRHNIGDLSGRPKIEENVVVAKKAA